MDMQNNFTREVRWRLLVALNASRPYGCNENTLLLALQDTQLDVSSSDIRRALDYLSKKTFVLVHKDSEIWAGELTADGIDVVEYNADCPKAIGRPQKYW